MCVTVVLFSGKLYMLCYLFIMCFRCSIMLFNHDLIIYCVYKLCFLIKIFGILLYRPFSQNSFFFNHTQEHKSPLQNNVHAPNFPVLFLSIF